MTEPVAGAGTMRVTASNGVTWTRRLGMTSTAEQLLQALSDLTGIYSDPARQWNWWQEGRRDQEYDLVLQVVSEWDRYGPRCGSAGEKTALRQAERDTVGKDLGEDTHRGPDLVVNGYDEDRERLRLKLLRTQSDVAFFGHVLRTPASSAQRDDAERRLNASRAAAAGVLDQLGDPEQVIDRRGHLPAERREMNLQSHMQFWRHPMLRRWATTQRRRFNALLAMPMPDSAAMCSECQAPAAWHDYDISLRLFQPPPAPGTQAGQLAQLIPGWWQRCPACTIYRVGHQWGGQYALPDFSYDQWRAMLPPCSARSSHRAHPDRSRHRGPNRSRWPSFHPGPSPRSGNGWNKRKPDTRPLTSALAAPTAGRYGRHRSDDVMGAVPRFGPPAWAACGGRLDVRPAHPGPALIPEPARIAAVLRESRALESELRLMAQQRDQRRRAGSSTLVGRQASGRRTWTPYGLNSGSTSTNWPPAGAT